MNKLIATGAAAYAGLGVVSFLRPAMVPALFGGSAPTVDSRSEIRAVYGGLPLAMAGTLLASPASAVPLGIATAGMAAGRAATMRGIGPLSATLRGHFSRTMSGTGHS